VNLFPKGVTYETGMEKKVKSDGRIKIRQPL
jgi:hypothetical protein